MRISTVILGALAVVLAWPSVAQEMDVGRLSGVSIAEDGTTWTLLLDVEDKQVAGDISYDHCQTCSESDGEYYCASEPLSPRGTYALACISRTKTVRGDIDVGSDFVRIEGDLKTARIDPGFYPRVEFTLLNARDFAAYRRFAATDNSAGTDRFAATHPAGEAAKGAAPVPTDDRSQLDRLTEERKKAEATLRELKQQRARWARERAELEQARRRLSEERAALEKAQPAYRRGQQAFEKMDSATALAAWRPLANQGHAEAQYRLGRMYENGWGVAKDRAQSLAWYRKAAGQGHDGARQVLGGL